MVASRISPRLRRVGIWLAAIMVAYGAFVYSTRRTWRPLPHGGDACLFKVGYGEGMLVKERGLELTALRDWMGRDLSVLLGPIPVTLQRKFGEDTLYIAFASRGSTVDDLPRTGYCEIDLPDGQTLRGQPDHLGTYHGEKVDLATFTLVPHSAKRLHVRLEFGGESLHFDVANPAYVSKRISWEAKPLPQAVQVHGREIVLLRLEPYRTYGSGVGSFWAVKAEGEIREPNGRASRLDSFIFHDPYGNASPVTGIFSEPFWKVRYSESRVGEPSYTNAEIEWRKRVPLPKPGEMKMIPVGRSPAGERHPQRALLGPGRYRLTGGKLTAIATLSPLDPDIPIRLLPQPPASTGAATDDITEIDSLGITLYEDYSNPQRWDHILGRRRVLDSKSPWLFMRDESGRQVALREIADDFGLNLHLITPAADAREVELGTLSRLADIDFIIKAPQPPEELKR